jgi:hypothetical protein
MITDIKNIKIETKYIFYYKQYTTMASYEANLIPAHLIQRKDIHTLMYKEILHNLKEMTDKADKNYELYRVYMKNYEDQYDWWEIAEYMWQVDHTYESLAIRFNIDVDIVRHMMS